MHSPTRHPNQKSQIRFIRSVAAPKQHAKTHSSSHILIANPSTNIYTIILALTFPNSTTDCLQFMYGPTTKVYQLLNFVKERAGSKYLSFKTGNIHTDYFLTLEHRLVIELKMTTNKLTIHLQNIVLDDVISLKSIQIMKCIGSGGFSKVLLARVFGIVMAIKIINKQFVYKTAKESLIQSQKQILQICQGHPFITKLFFSFQTTNFVVFGLQYCNGGQLFNLLRRIRKMNEHDAKFYLIQTLMAIEYLHQNGILYRDLKPQNIILDADGHLRLADFGLSKIINRSATYSFCGSAEYISPEMLQKKGHSYQVDFYCLGALVYELVTGLPPFYTTDQNQLFSNILYEDVTFPEHAKLSEDIKNFLTKMLQKQPENRFQSVQQILAHPWLASDFDRQTVMNKKMTPPYPTAVFNYNFDDSQFSLQESAILKEIDNQLKHPEKHIQQHNDIYYESMEIQNLRKSMKQTQNESLFTKNKLINFKGSDSFSVQREHRKQSIARISLKVNKESQKRLEPCILALPSKFSMNQAKSLGNLKPYMEVNPHLNKISCNPKMYIDRNRVVPSLQKQKVNNNVYTKYMDHSLQHSLNSSLSKEMPSFSKQKANSLQKIQSQNKKPDFTQNSISQFNSFDKNYLSVPMKQKLINAKVKKSFRNGQRINFQYASMPRP